MKFFSILTSSIYLSATVAISAAPVDSLQSGFLNPPDSAKPQTWWHWMNGNITKAGITADLEAMKQIGLGGATIVNVDCDIPPGDVPFMSPQWRDDFKFAVQEADRLGLKLCVENCAGWSSSGGPWNTPTNAMQCLTSSEMRIHGPANFSAALPQPPMKLDFYRDIAVLAFKVSAANASAGADANLASEKFEIQRAVFAGPGGSADVTAKISALIHAGRKSVVASTDELGGDPAPGEVKQLRVDYTLNGQAGTMTADEGETLIFPTSSHQLKIAKLHEKSSVDRTFVQPPPAVAGDDTAAVSQDEIVDLTSKLTADGKLNWNIPAGDWVVLRFGYTPTGVENHPAPATGLGLECDKFSKAALDAHWNGFMQKVLDDIGPLAGKALDSSLVDSYEVGGQDWTKNFREEFKKRRGYDPVKFLPVFTRHVVDSPEITERFLWDMRRTIADLFAENYYGHFAELCREHGLKNAVEPYEGPFESLQCGAPADVVMGEFWSGSQGHYSVKMAASIAHIYGKTFVGAESFTAAPGPQSGRWQEDPYSLKTLGDLMYCQGLNRYIFHRYAMQPWTNRWPGMTMGQWGFHFERTETWWHQGKAWIDYISHCQFLLQQGRAISDVAYFNGESAPVEMRIGNPATPFGYDYDAVDADVLLHGATVKNGRLTLASGANYAVLVLPEDDANLTPQLLKRIRELVRDGATVVGRRPQHSPSLDDFPRCDAQVKKLADELWGACDGKTVFVNADGKGKIILGKSLAEIFAAQNLRPDFEFASAGGNSQLAYVHRATEDADIYFVSNQRRQFGSADCTFRVTGKIPELWHPDTGVIEPAPVWSEKNGRTKVHLDFDPAGSVFVIFRAADKDVDQFVSVKDQSASEKAIAPKLEIQHAVYTATDGAGELDVTAKLSQMVQGDEILANVNNDTMGSDPAFEHVKHLVVDYTLDGKPGHAVVHENEMFALPKNLELGQAPRWEISTAEKSPAVKLWGDGGIELQTASGKTFHASATDVPAPAEIAGGWNLSFPPNWGAPESITLEKLISWPDSSNDGVRYFSGTATYEKEIEISPDRLAAGRELWLDLGTVKNFAEVSLNGQNLGVLWKPPFRVNITSTAKLGTNKLVVKVTNLWPNRLIGDEQLPPDREWDGLRLKAWPQWLLDGKPSPTGRYTFTTWHHWDKDSSLLESGLIGPVTLKTAEVIPVN